MSHSVKHSFATVLASLLCAAVIAMAVRAFASPIAFGQKPAPAKATEGLPPGPLQAKATTSCLECHEARIILQQRLNKGAWAKEVDKMIKWGAVVEASDHDSLIDYLSTNFGADQPPYEPVRTTSEGSRAGKKSK